MDRVEFAERRYAQIVPRPVQTWEAFPVERLTVWLRDDVCPVVEDFAGRPAFRERATWPLRVLVTGQTTPERALVDAVDDAIVRAAKALRQLSRQPGVHKNVMTSNPPRPAVVQETVELTGESVRTIRREVAPVDTSGVEEEQIERIAGRFWRDLVCPLDYMEPRGGWLGTPSAGRPRTAGEFVVSLNARLHPVGDFVTRCLFERVDGMVDLLNTVRRRCGAALTAAPDRSSGHHAEAERAWEDLVRAVDASRRACCNGPRAQVRDACITLTQVYVAFHHAPEMTWLGLAPDLLRPGIDGFRHRFTHGRNREMADRIAAALGDLRRLYEESPLGRSSLEEAIASGGLVLVSDPPTAYWEGHRLEAEWTRFRAVWRLFRTLVSQARVGAAAGERHLYEEAKSGTIMSTTMERLKKLLPVSLKNRIRPGTERRSYRLTLQPQRIFVFETDHRGR